MAVEREPGLTGRILILAAMPLFSIVRFGMMDRGSFGTATLLSAVSYGIAIYLFYGIAWLAYLRRTNTLWIGLLVSIVIGYVLSGRGDLWMLVTTWTMLIFASVITGRMNIDRYKQMPIYVAGAVVVAAVAVAQLYPIWSEYTKSISIVGAQLTADLKAHLTGLGASEALVADNLHYFQKMIDVSLRLLPASFVAGALVQFSIGYLLFLTAVDRRELFIKRVRPFAEWKVPFGVTPVLILAISLRIWGNGNAVMIADNVLALLSIYYCLCGLALMENILRRLNVPLWIKIVFYIMLFLTHVIGYLVTALLGFADSFADWRGVKTRPVV